MTQPPDATLLPVTVGFMPLVDAALLVIAREEGFAAAEGLDLALVREGSWAAIRDKLNVGLFDAAHMLAPAAIASTLGIGHLKVPLIAPLVLNLDGNAITVSHAIAANLRQHCANATGAITPHVTARALAAIVAARREAGTPPLTIGIVFGFSNHLYQMRAWLKLGGLDPENDARFVVIPPPLMVESLSAGLIDLFCAGTPWNRMAEIAGAGLVLHPCAAIAPDTVEKLLVLRQDCEDAPWLSGLIRALVNAARWTQTRANHSLLARHLARPDYLSAPIGVIEDILSGTAKPLFDAPPLDWIQLGVAATVPRPEGLDAVIAQMREAGQLAAPAETATLPAALLRGDLYRKAIAGEAP